MASLSLSLSSDPSNHGLNHDTDPRSHLIMTSTIVGKSLVLIQLLFRLPSVYAFSAWLPCHRYLEEDEVIMNNKVFDAPTDIENAVALAVYDSSDSRVDENSIVWIDEEVFASSRSISFRIGIDPSTTGGLSDIQYVMETHPFEDNNMSPSTSKRSGSPSPRVPTEPAPNVVTPENPTTGFTGASAGGGVLCDGKRSHARGKTGYVTYELAETTLKSTDDDQRNESTIIISEVWAGWAEGHSKVTLTPKLYFKLRTSSERSTKNDEL